MRGVDFYYEYLRELELKKAAALTLVFGTFAKSIHPKNRKTGLTAMSL
jgi:hypothetical protein